MEKIINIAEVVISILLIVSILLQNRGAGLGGTFGGSFGGYYTKRGFEKFLVSASVLLSGLFIILAAVNFALAK